MRTRICALRAGVRNRRRTGEAPPQQRRAENDRCGERAAQPLWQPRSERRSRDRDDGSGEHAYAPACERQGRPGREGENGDDREQARIGVARLDALAESEPEVPRRRRRPSSPAGAPRAWRLAPSRRRPLATRSRPMRRSTPAIRNSRPRPGRGTRRGRPHPCCGRRRRAPSAPRGRQAARGRGPRESRGGSPGVHSTAGRGEALGRRRTVVAPASGRY